MLRAILLPVMLILLLGIAALAVVLYKRYYTKQINRVLEEDGAVVAPTPALHKAWKFIAILVLFVCLFAWEMHKNNELDLLRQRCENMSYVMSRTWDTVKRMDAQLTDMQSSFSSFDYETEDLDAAARTIKLRFTAQPKEEYLDPSVTLRYNGESIELVRGADGYYSASVSMDPFRLPESNYATLCLTEGGRTKTEQVYLRPDVWDYFPRIKLDFQDVEIRQGSSTLKLRATPALNISKRGKLNSLHLRLIQNDQVLDEIDLTHAWGDDGGYTRLDGEYPNNAAIFFELRWEDCYGLTHTSVQYMIDLGQTEITYPYGDELGYDADGWYFRDIVSTADGKLLGELK